MGESPRDRIWRIIEEDENLSSESKAHLLDMLRNVEAEISAAPLTDPEVLVQARDLNRATQELTERLYAKQISGDGYHAEMMALLDGVPQDVLKTASKISGLVAAEMRLASDEGAL